MANSYRELCEKFVDAIDSGIPPERIINSPLLEYAHALLNQPEPEGPTDDEVDAWADANDFVQGHGDHPCVFWIKDDDLGMIVRAALAKWGNQ